MIAHIVSLSLAEAELAPDCGCGLPEPQNGTGAIPQCVSSSSHGPLSLVSYSRALGSNLKCHGFRETVWGPHLCSQDTFPSECLPQL